MVGGIGNIFSEIFPTHAACRDACWIRVRVRQTSYNFCHETESRIWVVERGSLKKLERMLMSCTWKLEILVYMKTDSRPIRVSVDVNGKTETRNILRLFCNYLTVYVISWIVLRSNFHFSLCNVGRTSKAIRIFIGKGTYLVKRISICFKCRNIANVLIRLHII